MPACPGGCPLPSPSKSTLASKLAPAARLTRLLGFLQSHLLHSSLPASRRLCSLVMPANPVPMPAVCSCCKPIPSSLDACLRGCPASTSPKHGPSPLPPQPLPLPLQLLNFTHLKNPICVSLCFRPSCSMKAEKESLEPNAVWALITRIGPCGASALGGLALLRVGKDIGEPWPHQRGLQGEALQRRPLSRGAC